VPGGRLLHEWSNGDADEEWVQIREKIRAMFEHEGVAARCLPELRTWATAHFDLTREVPPPREIQNSPWKRLVCVKTQRSRLTLQDRGRISHALSDRSPFG